MMDAPERERLERLAEKHKALGHPMRLALLERLGAGPRCVCELALDLGLNKSIASKHLTLLREVGILDMEKRATQVIYSVRAGEGVGL